MSDIGWGVISTGRIAEQFAQDLDSVTHGRLVAATSRTRANAQAFAEKYAVPRVHDTVDALLADDAVDAVYIATPHTVHLDNTLAAIAAGKAVLCEKPLTICADDARKIRDAATAAQCYVMEAMWTWFLPAIRQAKAWLDGGRIGRLVQVKADFGYPQRPYSPDMRVYDARLGGGALLEMGIYPVALLWLLMGRQPEHVSVVSNHAPNGVEDDLSALLDYGDVLATIGTSFRAKLQNWAYLIGEDGYIAIPDFWRASECMLYELETCTDTFTDARETIGLNFETQAVVDDLRAGRTESDVVPLAASVGFQETMETLRANFSEPSPVPR